MTKPQAARETPTCPCGGTCHHDERPCSLGCWSAQKPWRPEEARAALLDELEAAVRGLLTPDVPTRYLELGRPHSADRCEAAAVLALIQQHREEGT